MDPETRCAVCRRLLPTSVATAGCEPVCSECRAVSRSPESSAQPARADERKAIHSDPAPRASAETLRFDQPADNPSPQPSSTATPAAGSPGSGDALGYALAESRQRDRLGDRPVVEPPDGEHAHFGRFLIRGVLGQGAYGKVYRAFDPDLGREVALKILKRDVSDPNILRQLRQEARALGQLRHRHIVRVFEDGLHGNEYFIVSRLVDARPLSVILAGERVHPRQAAGWIRDVAEALAYAHRERILHRDVKPANILITSRSEALLADFGLALDVDEVNQEGALFGTPAYMAPEQIAGNPTKIGPHSDQYSLAVVLHELLTGHRPFADAVPGQPHVHLPDTGQRGSNVDRRLEAICQRALSPLPVDRYANLDAMATDLDAWLSGKKTQAKPRRLPLGRSLRRHAPFLAAATVAVVLAILLFMQGRFARQIIARLHRDYLDVTGQRDTKVAELDQKTREFGTKLAERAAEFEKERASFRQPLARLHLRRAEALQADGDLLESCVHYAAALDSGAQSWDDEEKQRVRNELSILAGRLIPVAPPSMWPRSVGPVPRVVDPELNEWLGIETDHPTRRWPARRPDTIWAGPRPDVAWAVAPRDEFALLVPGSLWRAADASLIETARDQVADCTAAAFKPDGRTVLVAYGNRIVRFWDTTTGKPLGEPIRHPETVQAISFAPDGRSALGAGQDRIVRRIDPTSGRVTGEVLRHPVPVKRLTYEPHSREFTTLGDDGIERRWDAENGSPRGIPVANHLSVSRIASSPDGRCWLKVIQGSRPERRFGQLWDKEGRPLGPPFPMFSSPEGMAHTGCGGEAILAGATRGPLLARLFIGSQALGNLRREDCSVRFTDDGKAALTVGLDETLRLWNASSLEPRGPAFQASRLVLALSRDGEIVATRGPGDAVKLWSTTRGKPIAELETRAEQVSQLTISPDGRLALSWSAPAFRFDNPPGSELNRWDVATGRLTTPPLDHGSRIRLFEFSPDSSTILTLGEQDDARLWNAATGRLVGSWPGETKRTVLAAAFAPDGKTLLIGGNDGVLSRWSTSSGLAAGDPVVVGSPIRFIAHAAKGRTLMTISAESTILWDAETGRRLGPPLPAGGRALFDESAASGAELSPDGMRVLTKEPYTGKARLWDATNASPLGPPCVVEGKPVLSSADGSVLVTITPQGPRVWDLNTGAEKSEFYPFTHAFDVVAESHDGKKVLGRLRSETDHHDRAMKRQGKRAGRHQLLDAISGRPLGESITLDEEPSGVALGPDGRILVVESRTNPGNPNAWVWTRLHDAVTGKPMGQPLPGSVTGFSPDGQIVLVGSIAWRLSPAHANDRLPPLDRAVRQVALAPDGRTVVTLAAPADLRRWDVASGSVIGRVPLREGTSVLCVSPDGRRALVAEGTIARIMQVETGREAGAFLNHTKPVTVASFAPDGKMLVTSEGTTLQVWDASTGRPVGGPRSCSGAVAAVAMGPGGMVYVEEAPDPNAEMGHRHVVWKEAPPRPSVIPEREPGMVAKFSPDGRYLFVGGNRSGRLWDLSADPPRSRPESVGNEPAKNRITSVAFAGDGRIYAVAFEDGTTEVRDIATDRRIGPPRKPGRQVPTAVSERFRQLSGEPAWFSRDERTPTSLSFSSDGQTLAIGFDDGLTRFWTIPLNVPEHGVSRWLERTTAVRLMPDLTLRPLDRDELWNRWSESGEGR
jgi:WD40 repeat protein